MSKTVKISLVTAFTVVLIAGIIACGGGGGTVGVPEDYLVSSATGGTFQYTSSGVVVSLSFPSGAVSTDTIITVGSSSATYDSNVIPGLGVEFLPEGLEFDELVTIVVTYDEADLGGADESELKIHRWSDPNWQRLPSVVDTTANTVTATLTGFSEYFLFPAVRKLYFTADDGVNGWSMWSWDGEEAVMDPDTNSANVALWPMMYQEFNDKLYFVMNRGELWSYDGAQPGSVAVLGNIGGAGTSSPFGLLPFNGKLYFLGKQTTTWELWSYSEEAGLTQETDTSGSTTYMPQGYMVYDGMIYFEGGDGSNDRELWRYDGENPPEQVTDISPFSGSSKPDGMTSFNGSLYFAADDGVHGRELWAYNSTSDITTMIKDIFPGDQNDDGIAFPDGGQFEGTNQFTPFNGKLYFAAASTTRGFISYNNLWVTDGTAEGTTVMSNPLNEFSISSLSSMFVVDGLLYFHGSGSYGTTLTGGLWVYDPADETSPRVYSNTVDGFDLIRWNDRWHFKCRLEVEPSVWTDYYGLCSSDGISEMVMNAYFNTVDHIESQRFFLEDSASH